MAYYMISLINFIEYKGWFTMNSINGYEAFTTCCKTHYEEELEIKKKMIHISDELANKSKEMYEKTKLIDVLFEKNEVIEQKSKDEIAIWHNSKKEEATKLSLQYAEIYENYESQLDIYENLDSADEYQKIMQLEHCEKLSTDVENKLKEMEEFQRQATVIFKGDKINTFTIYYYRYHIDDFSFIVTK